MWTKGNRGRYDRSKLRYPSDVTNEEWALIEPLISPAKGGGKTRKVVMREVVNGLMFVLSMGCQWRAIPKDLPPKSTVNLPLFGVSQGRGIMLHFFLLRQTPFFRPRGGPRTSSG